MRSLVRPLLLGFAAALLWSAPLRAEEAAPADVAGAEEVGRGLLSPDPKARARAQALLLERVRTSKDPAAFVRAMNEAVAAWADRHERLLEVWIHQAVHGDAEERDRAVRLLAALGPAAVERLALELRHRIQHAGAEPLPTGEKAPGDDAPPPPSGPHPEAERPPGVPQLYDLSDLVTGRADVMRLRSLIQKTANAVEVKHLRGDQFIVTAEPRGHEALIARLEVLRQAPAQRDGGAQEDEAGAQTLEDAPAKGDVPAPDDAAEDPAPQQAAVPAPNDAGETSAAPASWLVEPLCVQLPRGAVVALAGRPRPAAGYADVEAGSLEEAAAWARTVRLVPDARKEPFPATATAEAGRPLQLFAGKRLRYTKDVRRIQGGAWGLVTEEIPHGIELEVRLTPAAEGVHVGVAATRTQVGLPIPVVRVRPSPKSAPVELERPEWSTTRESVGFHVGAGGGGAFVPLRGLGDPGEGEIVLVLAVRPAPVPPEQRGKLSK